MKEKKKSCFIIMPLTTPEHMITKYRDGKEHFKHVLDCLFIPAIDQAGYNPIPPVAEGSDIIHANIINNIQTSDMVLCDMSCLNPNVFFEFGIRTSLNKPVCAVKDELTKKVPFDTGIINYQEYNSLLNPWDLKTEIDKLNKHINNSINRSNGENTLWKYFGLKTKAVPYEGETGLESKVDYLTLQIDSLKEAINAKSKTHQLDPNEIFGEPINYVSGLTTQEFKEIETIILNELAREKVFIQKIDSSGLRKLTIYYNGKISPDNSENIKKNLKNEFDVRVDFVPNLDYR